MTRRTLFAMLLTVVLSATTQAAEPTDLILELRDASQISKIAKRYHLEVLDQIDGQSVFLVHGEIDKKLLRKLEKDRNVVSVEHDESVSLATVKSKDESVKKDKKNKTSKKSKKSKKGRSTKDAGSSVDINSTLIWLFGEDETTDLNYTQVEKSYGDQPALDLIGVTRARSTTNGAGIRIAFIDTGVDPEHPALKTWVDEGVDLLGTGSTSEWSGIDSTLIWLFDEFIKSFKTGNLESTLIWLFGEAMEVLEDNPDINSTLIWLFSNSIEIMVPGANVDSTLIWLFGEDGLAAQILPPKFGHGTLVAGLLHVVAPEATLVPIRAFDSYGHSTLFLTTAAVYAAVNEGVDVINLSFSIGQESRAFKEALDFAWSHGIAVVASVGNDGVDAGDIYPAAYPHVIAVGATDLEDRIASFSNYGKSVDLMAPGQFLVSTYPGGLYAHVSGTSFSAPMVSGSLALLMSLGERNGSASNSIIRSADDIDKLNPDYKNQLGWGRLDVWDSIQKVRRR